MDLEISTNLFSLLSRLTIYLSIQSNLIYLGEVVASSPSQNKGLFKKISSVFGGGSTDKTATKQPQKPIGLTYYYPITCCSYSHLLIHSFFIVFFFLYIFIYRSNWSFESEVDRSEKPKCCG